MLKILPMIVHYNKNMVASILSFDEVESLDGVHIQYNGNKEKAFYVIFDN